MVGEFWSLWVEGVEWWVLCWYGDEGVLVESEGGNGEGRRYFFGFGFGGLVIKGFIGGGNG